MTFIDSIVVYDVDDHHFDEIVFVTVGAGQDEKELAVYYDTIYVFVTQKGLVEYQLTHDSTFSFGIHDMTSEGRSRILAFPNPCDDRVTIGILSSVPDEWQVVIYDLTGRQMLKKVRIVILEGTVERGGLKKG